MSLHGTLETFALPDVLALLAATKKSGELRVVGGKTDGRVWFDAGAVVGAEVGRAVGYVDAVFELLRLESGKFSFDAEKSAATPGDPSSIEPLVAEAQARLAEWRAIEAVIPSVAHGVTLAAEVDDPHVMVTGAQWRALVGVSSAPTVSAVIDRLGLGEFEACRTLKGLVDAGLVVVEERAAAPAPAPAPEAVVAPEPARAPEPAPAPVAEEPVVAAEPQPAPQPEPAPVAPERPKIQALTSTSAGDAPAVEAATPASEADELVRQVAAMEAQPEAAPAPAPAPPAAVEPQPEPAPEPEPAPAAAPEAPAAEAPEEPTSPDEPAPDAEEPINRGLLLKFLSSVRT